MKLKGLLVFLMCSLALATAEAQQYNYRHYTTRDGLPSSTVYSIVQDDEGFMWFSTSQGVARFDGYKFKTYTVLDGLPDNDVLAIFKGQKGRLWFVAFNKQVSYYDAGAEEIKVYEKYNLPTLAINVVETTDGKVWIGTKDKGLQIIDNHQTTLIDSSNLPMVDNCFQPFADNNNQMWLSGRMRFFPYENPSAFIDIHPFQTEVIDGSLGDFVKLHQLSNGTLLACMGRQVLAFDKKGNLVREFTTKEMGEGVIINAVSSDASNNILTATQTGAYLFPYDTALPHQRFLIDKPISHFEEDNEGNYWFTTLNDGIYMLPASSMLVNNISSEERNMNIKISSFFSLNDDVFFTAHNGVVGGWVNGVLVEKLAQIFYLNGLNNCQHLDDSLFFCSSNFGVVVFKDIKGLGNSTVRPEGINGYDSLLAYRSFIVPAKPFYLSLGGIRQLVKVDSSSVWLSGQNGLMQAQYNSASLQITVTRRMGERVTAMAMDGDANLWYSTLDSIGQVNPEGTITSMPLERFGIKGNITSMITDRQQNLWFATAGYGMYVFDGDSLFQIDLEEGLSSAFVNCMVLYDSNLVLGTSNGINIIRLSPLKPYYSQVYPLSINDALVSQEINALLVHEHMLYIGTNQGISLAAVELLTADTTKSQVYFSRLQINDADTTILASYTLPHYLNNIKLEYIGLLYKANGNIQYRYQMEGIDTGWVQTSFTNVQYPTMPPGSYTFKVDARSLQGPWSEEPATMQITILPPFWKTWWFRISVGVVIGSIVLGISYGVIRYYKNQSRIAQRMVQLEGQALRAQMNPHFIFNALNAIHDFIANQDERSAHLYLGKFAMLIRKILDQSRKQEIALEEEISTLKLYMELEALRFPQRFEYDIECEEALLENDFHIPPMLVQPYVENAIRHGLMNSHRTGRLRIAFKQVGDLLEVTVEDNGIGREKAMEISSKRLVKHRSAGMEITHQRIALQGADHTAHNNLTITDLFNADKTPSGTRVTFYVSPVHALHPNES